MSVQNPGLVSVQTLEAEMYEKACKVMPGGISRNVLYRKPHPFYVDHASGCYITDVNGVQKLDLANNIASLILGHAHPAIVEAVTRQLQKGTAFTLGTEVEIEMAKLMCDRVESFDKIRFVNSGTEAVMAMIRAARAYTGKPVIARAEGAYHGSYDYAQVSQASTPENWGDLDEPNKIPNSYGTPQSVLDDVVVYPYNDIDRTLNLLDKYKHSIGCVLIDPLAHRIGMVKADEAFIEAIYEWTRQNNALMCFDEVICFRVNYGGAQADYQVMPDLTALGKVIGGGFPIGALGGRDEVMRILNPGDPNYRMPLSGTFSANPISLTAGKVAMELFDQEAVNKVGALAEIAKKQVLEAAKLADIPLSISGQGSMFKLHFREKPPVSFRDHYESPQTKKAIQLFLDHVYENHVMLINSCTAVFSTAVTPKEVDMLTEAMLSGFRHIKPHLET